MGKMAVSVLMVSVVFLLSVSEGISQCPPSSGIYLIKSLDLIHNGTCYPNGSYFWDNSVDAVTEAVSCVLPGTSLTTGQWVRVADPDDPVDCNSNSASDPFLCTNVTSPNATLSLYLAQGLSAQEGWYKCCLPTDCSDPHTNIIFANIFIPATAPSSLTEVNKTATTITVSWTALDSSDADGYVVNVTSGTDTVQTVQVEGSSNNTISLNGLHIAAAYSITVRAYQQLLGPASTISVQTLPVINSIDWTLVSPITQLSNTQYRIDCLTTTDINPLTDVYWLVNGVIKNNSMHTSIDALTYNNTLLVYPDLLGVSVNVTCIAMIGGLNYSQSVILHVPSGWPSSIDILPVNSTANYVIWNEVNCSQHSGLITGYTVIISNSSITYNLTSTERYTILNDLVFGTEYNISVAAVNTFGRGPFSISVVVEIGIVGSVSSIMDTTWAVISWSVPSYIPSDYPIITYEIGYHASKSGNCSTMDERHGYWKLIANETLNLQPSVLTVTITYTVTSPSVTSGGNIIVITMIAFGLILIIATVNIVNNICLIIRIKSMSVKHTRSNNDIAMQVCEPYDLHKSRISEENIDQVYDESQMSPDPVYEMPLPQPQ
uniref:Fibronectin type-III domain-containing protein n=1 Tax=Amphimedon queenslandica TaxID=400682 RepID=A0A1X7U5E8_AMPQE